MGLAPLETTHVSHPGVILQLILQLILKLILIDSTNNSSTKTSAKPAAGFELLRVRAPAKQVTGNKHC